MKVTNALLRGAAGVAVARRGYEGELVRSKGVLPGARLRLLQNGNEPLIAAVRTSQERAVGFSRNNDKEWRTLRSVDIVLACVLSDRKPTSIEVYAFDADSLAIDFDAALSEIESPGRKPPPNSIPIYIPLDERSDKDFGHSIAGIKTRALWKETVDLEELDKQRSAGTVSELIERVKREYAKLVGVDADRVTVEFRVTG